MARRSEKDAVCLGSITRVNAEIMPINVFVKHIEKAINQIEKRVGKLENLEGKQDTAPINVHKLGGMKLFCLNL